MIRNNFDSVGFRLFSLKVWEVLEKKQYNKSFPMFCFQLTLSFKGQAGRRRDKSQAFELE